MLNDEWIVRQLDVLHILNKIQPKCNQLHILSIFFTRQMEFRNLLPIEQGLVLREYKQFLQKKVFIFHDSTLLFHYMCSKDIVILNEFLKDCLYLHELNRNLSNVEVFLRKLYYYYPVGTL